MQCHSFTCCRSYKTSCFCILSFLYVAAGGGQCSEWREPFWSCYCTTARSSCWGGWTMWLLHFQQCLTGCKVCHSGAWTETVSCKLKY